MVTAGFSLGDRYRLVSRIGRGGMAEVWTAVDTVLQREVAVKIPLGDETPGSGDRLRREARIAARLAHPHIAAVHDYGEAELPGDGRVPYVVMERLHGEALAARLRRGPLPWRTAATLFAQVADGLAAAHSVGVVHRDLNPSNVFITASGARILDFGIAFTDDGETTAPLMGTPGFVAPELLTGARPSPAADMYGFGASLAEALTGKDGTEPPDSAPQPLLEPTDRRRAEQPEETPGGVPEALLDLCDRCRAEEPDDRPGAAAAASVLRHTLETGEVPTAGSASGTDGADPPGRTRVLPGPAPRRRLVLVATTVVTVLAAVLVAALLRPGGDGGNPAPGASPTPTPPPDCRVAYRIDDEWPDGFKAGVTITNIGRTVINGWRLSWEFADGQRVSGLWNGVKRQNGGTVTVTNADYNVSIKPRRSVAFGFTASRSGANTAPTEFTLNGHPCRV